MADELAALRRQVEDLKWRIEDQAALGVEGNASQLEKLRDTSILWLAALHGALPPTPRAQRVADEIDRYQRRQWQSDRAGNLVPSAASPKRWALYLVMRYTHGRGLKKRKIKDIIDYSKELSKSGTAQKLGTVHFFSGNSRT